MFKKNKIRKTQTNKSVNSSISNLAVCSNESKIINDRKHIPDGTPLSSASFQPNAIPFTTSSSFIPTSSTLSSSLYMENLSVKIWELYGRTKQSPLKYKKKICLLNALHMVISGVFENAGLYIVGSSINGFGSNQSDMDMCLLVTSRDLHQKNEATFILSRLLQSLRKCRFLHNFTLIRAKVPIIKFRDKYAGIDCDLNVNNVIGLYNTHLLAMYAKVDWRVRPLGIFIKHWAQCMDIHDAQRGRLSTYCLLLMLIHYLQTACIPPVLPNLQEKFPEVFNYTIPPYELDMNGQLPWNELKSTNFNNLGELFNGFIHYYTNEFNFNKWAITIRHNRPFMKNITMKQLPIYEQNYIMNRNCKIFIEEPFSQTNAARSIHSDNIVSYIKQAFIKTNEILSNQYPLESIMELGNN
ncbi:poly(A) polymerase cid (pap) (caffein-induced death protein), putative [Schistosoma mansoni]|uniref:Poly(A) polymerase cid (Pap) (Caffein-induced death protein), putative n=1 Tax=Schistosoma mansoni TaxID=6183 RepID=G4LZE6_SCHMA|nr:poly(A) polymerase cid (pap) (caffein-induced death protein), putative [Schistosoma mansoni]|eukprot:XP_018646614.1 poly(A) polymerase cid (pap) (caffein-induced death protein), putative [Schistosoma mansoni]